jgi:RimJ/RimL family protein N-acetyltransferase
VLRPATDADLPALEALAASEAVEPFLAPGAAARLRPALASADEELLAIVGPGGTLAGAARFSTRSPISRIVSLHGVMLDPAVRGTGFGVAAVRALTAHAFAAGHHRVEAEVYGFNAAGRRTFAAAGFAQEGLRRRAYDRHGAWQDSVLFALLADEAGPEGHR